jgi:hypothetical protein
MHSELSNLYLFAFAIAKVGALTGLIPAILFVCALDWAERWSVWQSRSSLKSFMLSLIVVFCMWLLFSVTR